MTCTNGGTAASISTASARQAAWYSAARAARIAAMRLPSSARSGSVVASRCDREGES